MCTGAVHSFAGWRAAIGRRRAVARPVAVALLLFSGVAARAAQWVYDDYLTLALTMAPRGGDTRVRADALLPRDAVEAWTDASMAPTTADGTKNPAFGKSRGYRVRITVAREGAPSAVRQSGGIGPLVDRVGVFCTRIAGHEVWMRSGYMRAEFVHPAGAAPATYEVSWYIDCKLARKESLRLPQDGTPQSGQPDVGLSAHDGWGIYPPGTTLGVPYPFRQAAPPAGWPKEGAGLLVASLSPDEAQSYLGLLQRPKAPVLIGWQPDGGDCLAWFYGADDTDIAVRPSGAEALPVTLGQVLATAGSPQAFRLADDESGLTAAVALGPATRLRSVSSGTVELERGTLRVSVHDGAPVIRARDAVLQVTGLALVAAEGDRLRAWCLTRDVTVGDEHLRSGEMATVGDGSPVKESFDLSGMTEIFLSTCLVTGDNDRTRETSADEVTRASGVITDVILCEGLDSAQHPLNPGTAFPGGIAGISVLVGYRTPPQTRARVTVSLVRESETRAKSTTEVTGSGKFVAVFRPRGETAYSPGRWQIQVHVDDRLDRRIDFSVGQ